MESCTPLPSLCISLFGTCTHRHMCTQPGSRKWKNSPNSFPLGVSRLVSLLLVFPPSLPSPSSFPDTEGERGLESSFWLSCTVKKKLLCWHFYWNSLTTTPFNGKYSTERESVQLTLGSWRGWRVAWGQHAIWTQGLHPMAYWSPPTSSDPIEIIPACPKRPSVDVLYMWHNNLRISQILNVRDSCAVDKA